MAPHCCAGELSVAATSGSTSDSSTDGGGKEVWFQNSLFCLTDSKQSLSETMGVLERSGLVGWADHITGFGLSERGRVVCGLISALPSVCIVVYNRTRAAVGVVHRSHHKRGPTTQTTKCKVMSQQARTAERQRDHQHDQQSSESFQGGPGGPSGRSAPRDFPSASGRGRHSHSRQPHAAGQSEAPHAPQWGSTGSSYDSSRGHLHGSHAPPGSSPSGRGYGGRSGSDSSRQQSHRTGTSAPTTSSSGSRGPREPQGQQRSSSGSGSRYGQWPPPGSSPADSGGVGPRAGSSSRSGSRQGPGMLRHSSSSGRSTGRGFSWPAYMDRTLLQQAMKRGQVFRCVLTNAHACVSMVDTV
jgi:hypothetical protein